MPAITRPYLIPSLLAGLLAFAVLFVLPAESEREARDYQLNFKFFQRIDGTFKLAPGSVLKRMQVRVFENGSRAPKLTQRLSVS